MKKYSLLLLMATFSSGLFCQQDTLIVLDSIYSYVWDTVLSDLVISERQIYKHDVYGNETEHIQNKWDSETNVWTNYIHEFQTNDANGDVNYMEIHLWQAASDRWSKSRRVFESDTKGNLIDYFDEWNHDSNDWVFNYRDIHAYDANGNESEKTKYKWDSETSDWVNRSKSIYAYDANGNRTVLSNYQWDSETNDWVAGYHTFYSYDAYGNETGRTSYRWDSDSIDVEEGYRWIYVYDANGNQTESTNSQWDTISKDWVPKLRNLISYNPHGNEMEEIRYDWNLDSNDWVFDWRTVSAYDIQGKLVDYIGFQWDFGINDWGEDYRFAYGYDANNNLTLENKLHWESATENWFYDSQTMYYWSQLTTSVTNNTTDQNYNVYPNPFTDYATIELSDVVQTQRVELIDIHGRVVRSIDNVIGNTVTIHRESLPSGIYFIRVYTDDTYIRKVIVR